MSPASNEYMHHSCGPDRQRNQGNEHSTRHTRKFSHRHWQEPEQCVNNEYGPDQQHFVPPTFPPRQPHETRQKDQDHCRCGKHEKLLTVSEGLAWQGDDEDDGDGDGSRWRRRIRSTVG